MKNKILYPQANVFWYLNKTPTTKLTQNIKADVLVIGGGMAGLSAAQSFANKGFNVTLIEKYFCGAGASGKSSGFITPDSELNLPYFVTRFGPEPAKKIWDFGTLGTELIKQNIKNFSLECDYKEEDVVVVATSKSGVNKLEKNHKDYQQLSFESFLYDKKEMQNLVNSDKYFGAIRYPNTFGINCFLYCQAMKKVLEKNDVNIFEDTPALTIDSNTVKTPQGTIQAKYIIVCIDRFLPELHKLSSDVFHAQTFLMVSSPLNEQEIRTIFPHKRYMVWDTDLIYQYYRIIDKNRLLIGGSDLLAIFWGKEQHNLKRIHKKLSKYIKTKFPETNINFEYIWPGLIGISKDVMPVATQDTKNPNIYYISASVGLPWAAALGWYSAQRMVNNDKTFDQYFSPQRFKISRYVQKVFGKRITFGISNFIQLYFKNQ